MPSKSSNPKQGTRPRLIGVKSYPGKGEREGKRKGIAKRSRPTLKHASTYDAKEASKIKYLLESQIEAGEKPFFEVLNVVTNGRADKDPEVYDKYLKELKEEGIDAQMVPWFEKENN